MAGNQGYREFAIANRTFAEQQDEQARSITSASVDGMNIRRKSDLLTEISGSKLNDFTVVEDMLTTPSFEEPFPRMLGINNRVFCDKQLRLEESLQALNTKFYSIDRYEDPRIVIPASATASVGRETYTIDNMSTAGLITTAANPHNLTVGDVVYFNLDVDVTTGLGIPLQGHYWYVRTTPAANTLTISQIPGGETITTPTIVDRTGTFVAFNQTQSPAPRVVFNNCVFVREAEHGTRPFIRIEDGARAVFVGCYFIGLSGPQEDNTEMGMVRIDSSFTRDVQFVGCVRYPDGGYYTTALADAGGIKTGCL